MVKVRALSTMKRCSTEGCIASSDFFKFKYLSLEDIANNNFASGSVLYECTDARLTEEQICSCQEISKKHTTIFGFNLCHSMNSYSVVILGELSVGKSALCRSFFQTGISVLGPDEKSPEECNDGIFDDAADGSTTNHHLFERPIVVNGTRSRIRILDVNTEKQFLESSGSDGFGNLGSYLDAGDGYIVSYAVTDMGTFETARSVISRISQSLMMKKRNRPVILVGNKCDLVRKRQVSTEEGIKLAEKFNVKFVETSATLNQNVEELFHGIIHQIRLREEGNKTKSLKKTEGFQKESKPRLRDAFCFPLNGLGVFHGKSNHEADELDESNNTSCSSRTSNEIESTKKIGLRNKCLRKLRKKKGPEHVKSCQNLSVM